MAGAHRGEYDKRVNRVIDHIRRHLADELPLAALARVAAFSPFHFHRVFRAVTGETVAGFVQRLRISPAAFARAFRARFGMTATAWRAGGAARWRQRWRKAGQQLRKPGKAPRRRRRQAGRMSVRVADMPSLHVAFERVWDRVFADWLPGSGYQPDDRPCDELYRGDPSVDGRGNFRCELHLPVRRL